MVDTVRTQSELLARMVVGAGGQQLAKRGDVRTQTLRDLVVSIPTLGGGAGGASIVLDLDDTTVNSFNTTAEVVVYTLNIAAGQLAADGDAIRTQFNGGISNNSGGNANHTFRVDIQGAGLAIATFDAQNPFVDNILGKFWTMLVTMMRVSATQAHCWATLTLGSNTGGGGDDSIAQVLHVHDNLFTWDHSLARDFTLSMQMSVANALTGFQLKGVMVESLNQ